MWGVSISILVILLELLICRTKSLRLKVWAFNIAALLSIAYHAELLFVVFGGDKNIPNLYELHDKFFFNKPYLEQHFSTEEYVSNYRTNCEGIRIDELTNPDDSIKACDWLFIGDSFTQGAQVNYNQLFTSLIYKDFPDKVIVNAGISGAGLYEELNFYKVIGQKLHPKKVFLQIGVFNDFKDIVEHNASFQDFLSEKSSLYRYLTYHLGQSDETPLGRWMEPFYIHLQDNIDNNILYKPSSEKKELDKQRFGECIADFKKSVESNGAELYIILLPSKEQISNKILKETLKVCNLNEEDIDLLAANRLCSDVAQKEGLNLIDMYDDFKSSAFPFFEMDEHLSISGHELIAQRIVKEFESESRHYEYISQKNANERYPSLLSDSVSLLYQSQDKNINLIYSKSINDNATKVLWSSYKELVHPSISSSLDYMVFTIGNQAKHQTEVVLYNFSSGKQIVLNDIGCSASIPMFNSTGSQIVFPQWNHNLVQPYITGYDIASLRNIFTFKDGVECWRPIFSKDGNMVYYICREAENDHFIIKSYSVKDKSIHTILKTDYDMWDISMSPSGKRMAYAGNKNGNWDLFLLDIENGNTKQITNTLGNEWDPSFGTSDNDLWFAGEFGINNGIYHITFEP